MSCEDFYWLKIVWLSIKLTHALYRDTDPLKILLLTYKAINGLAPFYLQELINLKEACKYKLRSDCDGLLLNPVKFKTLTTLGDRSFAVAAPQLWNLLPYAIRSSPSVASFKKTLKTFLFQKALS